MADTRLYHILSMMVLFGVGDPCRQSLNPLLTQETEVEFVSRAEELVSARGHPASGFQPVLPHFQSRMDNVDLLASIVKVVIQNMG